MERRMKAKQGLHPRSKSFSEELVNNTGSHHQHRQATYDDSQMRKMEVDSNKDVWMNSFSSWKMKRIKATSSERDRKAERDEVEETQEKLKQRKSKTFREIVEEKQRRENTLQSDEVDDDELGAGEITNILADLPSTNLDSDNDEEHHHRSPLPVMEKTRTPRFPRKEEKQQKELNRQRSNTLPTNNSTRDGSVKRVPPPVKPKPRSRSGSLRECSNSIEQKLTEPEVLTTTDSRSTYSAPPPSIEQRTSEGINAATNSSRSMYAAAPPVATRRREPELVEEPDSFHDRLLKARQYEKDDVQQKAKEAARKPYKPKRSSIFAKIRAFDTGAAFNKVNDEKESGPNVEEKRKFDAKDEEDDFEDLVIIMSQRARSQRGFGFQTSGGYDEKKPLVVSSVSTGSVADYSDLKVGDEIININKESTRRFNLDDVHQCLSQSILTGKLTCKVRRYPENGKSPEKKIAVQEPVFQKSKPLKEESQPPPVQSQPPPVRSQTPPVHQPVRTSQPPVERVTAVEADSDSDVLRPGPTKNALARARQMLDDLEMDEDESLESSSKSSDIVDLSSVPPANRLGNKPFYNQPIKTNGYVPHNSSQDEGSSQNFQPKPAFRSVSPPEPYQSKTPEPYKPPSSHDVEEPINSRSGMNQKRNEFFIDEDWKEKPLDEMDNLWKQVEEPVVALDEETSEMMPSHRPIKPSTAHRKPFNREEERKRLERWNEEQERRRQEKYQQEQQRLFEEQERTLQAATEDVQKKRDEEERSLEERRRTIQRQQEELRQIRQRQIEEEENRRKARLEQERQEREEAEQERKEAEERRAEEERRNKEMMEAAEKERIVREKKEEEEKERERLQREHEQRENAAREKIRKEQEEYAKMLKEREAERQEQERTRADAEQKRLEEEEADREREEIKKWRLENEERQEEAAKLNAERDAAMREEAQRKFEAEERERIRAEERELMRREWEEERKRDLEQLRMEKEQLQKEREEMVKRQNEEKRKLQMEMGRVKKEQNYSPVTDVMSKQQLGMSHSPRNGHSPQNGHSPGTTSPGSQRMKENNQKNMLPERDQPSSHSIMSQYKDPNIPINQHWLIEEAERRRRAEEQGIERKLPPDVIIPPYKDLHAPQKPRHPNPYPRGFDPEIPTRLPAQKKPQSYEAPASTNAVQRRLRKPAEEAELQRKMQNRRSLPDLTGGKVNAVPDTGRSNGQSRSGQAAEPPISRSSDHTQHSIPGQSSAFQEPNKDIPPNQAISGKLQCCNCGKSLGRGAAMIIESLGLHYHVECFRCCVCSIRLGNGRKGTDVRIRASQLHCQNCYSNEAGFQFTEV